MTNSIRQVSDFFCGAGTEPPYISVAHMREVDRLAPQRFGVDLVGMMENAGRHLAHLARSRFLGGTVVNSSVLVTAGTGGNGGGALVAARNLHNWGASVRVILTKRPEEYAGVIEAQLRILQMMGIVISEGCPEAVVMEQDLLIDGIIGYSLEGAPRAGAAELVAMIAQAAKNRIPVLSLDIPSGVDADSGRVYSPAIRAAATMTLALPKRGMLEQAAGEAVGELYVADIGVPREVYSMLEPPMVVGEIFAREQIVRIR